MIASDSRVEEAEKMIAKFTDMTKLVTGEQHDKVERDLRYWQERLRWLKEREVHK
jgi:hypothetical protein